MPHRHAAVKKLRQDKKKRQHNLKIKLRIKKAIRKFQDALEEKPNEAKIALKEVSSLLDKAALKNIVNKNSASRKKSRLTKSLNKHKGKSSPEAKDIKKPA